MLLSEGWFERDVCYIRYMKSLLFEGVPVFSDNENAQAGFVSGTNVYREEVIKALFRYGTYDAYFFLWRTPFLPIPEDRASRITGAESRARVISICNLDELSLYDDVALFSPTPYITSLIPLRSRERSSRWIASGIAHSLDGWDMPYLPLSFMHSDIDEADSLICSTESGKRVLENLFAFAEGQRREGASPEPYSGSQRPSLPVLPLGIDCQDYRPQDKGSIRRRLGISIERVIILYVGRISPISKCDLWPLICVIARMLPSHPALELIIAGDDTQHDMAELLEAEAQMLGCGDRVRVRPNIGDKEKRELFAAADIFVSPSDNTQETFGLTIAEAMAAALPVVASDWNGYKELVKHGDTGFLIPTYWLPLGEGLDHMSTVSFFSRNSLLAASTIVDVEGLEFYLRLLIERPDLRDTMGRCGRRYALESYDWNVVIKGYEAVWQEGFSKSHALRVGKGSFAACPTHYPYQEVFSHYPSRILDHSEAITITPGGRQFAETDTPPESLVSPNGITNLDHVRQLLRIADALGPATVERLTAHVIENMKLSRLIAVSAIGFSLKYDFLKLSDSRPYRQRD